MTNTSVRARGGRAFLSLEFPATCLLPYCSAHLCTTSPVLSTMRAKDHAKTLSVSLPDCQLQEVKVKAEWQDNRTDWPGPQALDFLSPITILSSTLLLTTSTLRHQCTATTSTHHA